MNVNVKIKIFIKSYHKFFTNRLTAESEEEKRSWVEALNDAIAEGLSDYKVSRITKLT